MDSGRIVLTREGYEYLQQELRDLEGRLSEAESDMADISDPTDKNVQEEGAEFDVRFRNDIDEERANFLRRTLADADVLEDDPDPDRVNAGDTVVVWDFYAQQEMTFTLLPSEELVGGRDGVSTDSPVGMALMDHRVGDVVEVAIPDGKARYAIRRFTEASGGNTSMQEDETAAASE